MSERNPFECPHGKDPNECPGALGIVIDGIKWDEDGIGHPYREWHPVCMDGDLCPVGGNK